MKIVILDGYCLNPGDLSWADFEALGQVSVYDRTPLDDVEEIVRRIDGCDIVLTNKTPVTREVLARCPGVRYIGVLATGFNVVDIQAAAERGIPVCNVPGYGTGAVAQFAIALLLEVCHHIGEHSRAVHAGQWSSCPDYCFWNYPLVELEGKTMGIIGYGRIGSVLANKLSALGVQVTVSARSCRDIARIEAAGMAAADTRRLTEILDGFPLVFNTVPAAVLGAAELAKLPAESLVIDLASQPGGIDLAATPPAGVRVIHALSLPGKAAPVTASIAVRDTIYAILNEEGIL